MGRVEELLQFIDRLPEAEQEEALDDLLLDMDGFIQRRLDRKYPSLGSKSRAFSDDSAPSSQN